MQLLQEYFLSQTVFSILKVFFLVIGKTEIIYSLRLYNKSTKYFFFFTFIRNYTSNQLAINIILFLEVQQSIYDLASTNLTRNNNFMAICPVKYIFLMKKWHLYELKSQPHLYRCVSFLFLRQYKNDFSVFMMFFLCVLSFTGCWRCYKDGKRKTNGFYFALIVQCRIPLHPTISLPLSAV